jgi:hypothetical protein
VEPQSEDGTTTRAFAPCADPAAMEFHEALDQRESEAKAAAAPANRSLPLNQRLEHPAEQFRLYACAVVNYFDDCVSAVTRVQPEGDPAAAGRELRRVLKQVADSLRNPGGVHMRTENLARHLDLEIDSFAMELLTMVFTGRAHEVVQFDGLALEQELAL